MPGLQQLGEFLDANKISFFLGGKIQKMELNKTQGHGLHCAFYSFCIIFSFIFLSLREKPQLATVYVMLASSQKDVIDYK